MHEHTHDSLSDLQRLAWAIKAQCGHSCVIIDILLELSEQDAPHIRTTCKIPDSTFSAIDRKFAFPAGMSKLNFGRHVLPYLNLRQETYARFLAAYENRDDTITVDSVRTALGITKPNVQAFLLGTSILTWCFFSESLDDLNIEDDRTYDAARGYLVSKRLVFANPLDLLQTSHAQKWHEWRKLWAFF